MQGIDRQKIEQPRHATAVPGVLLFTFSEAAETGPFYAFFTVRRLYIATLFSHFRSRLHYL